MNEITAILFYVLYAEQATSSCTFEPLKILNDVNHIEADIYQMFNAIMKCGIRHMYECDEQSQLSPIERLMLLDNNMNRVDLAGNE